MCRVAREYRDALRAWMVWGCAPGVTSCIGAGPWGGICKLYACKSWTTDPEGKRALGQSATVASRIVRMGQCWLDPVPEENVNGAWNSCRMSKGHFLDAHGASSVGALATMRIFRSKFVCVFYMHSMWYRTGMSSIKGLYKFKFPKEEP